MLGDHIYIFSGSGVLPVSTASLLYISAEQAKTKITTTEGIYYCKVHLGYFERFLSPMLFCRIHDYHIVALNKIVSFDNDRVQMPGAYLPMKQPYLQRLKQHVRIINPEAEVDRCCYLVVNQYGQLEEICW